MEEMREYTVQELEDWSKRIEDVVGSFGLDWYPQEFEIVDYEMMLGILSYNGIPSYYPHWSFGKAYERQSTLYKYGLTYLPYELVINTNPSIAVLMNENPLPLQILTMAHVYGHNNFFKNNVNFQKGTRAELALEFFRASAERIRSYIADPSIGLKKVEQCIDAAHALKYHSSRIPGDRYVTQEEKTKKARTESPGRDLKIFPIEPEENFLLFIRDHSPKRLEDWQKDIMTTVAESFDYFKPQILTKIMNEGWASYWHHKIIRTLPLSPDLRLAIADFHSRVVRPPENPMMINPYYTGIEIWRDISQRQPERLFHAMRTAGDASFLRAYLTQELMAEMGFFSYKTAGQAIVVDEVVEEDSWKKLKQLMIRDTGLGSVPVIHILHADYEDARSLYLKHFFDGRNLEQQYTQKTLEYVHYFWGRPIFLETATFKRKAPFIYKYDGKAHTKYRRR